MNELSKIRDRLRIVGLAITLGFTWFTFSKLLVKPIPEKQEDIVFPATVISLSGWNYRGSDGLHDPDLEGKVYRYRQGDRVLEIEMRQITYADGNIDNYLQKYHNIKPLLTVKQEPEVGFYSLFVDSEKAYLSSCINLHGESTVTAEQFAHNRNTDDLQLHRILSWLLGQSDLRDWRCLWVNLSIPLDNYSQEETYLRLEQAWFKWYNWWKLRE
ncbi:cyanoexosortase A system-associated protein [Roseofilum casamattae]|uniref:Cyanoexosortase A system-associated protein n=1 Tax=Roseofilum casamattae BLCC-M143 TaxID=3022442 RepID=A0ABT7BZQ0_9CYAN|nr:cyanoexosortase A system-associated protein [Roseofilum casamattae]MDJ1184683.1 cyanoexosortase A system-associated protein [Roseofilum casamattae BLCC-M143]